MTYEPDYLLSHALMECGFHHTATDVIERLVKKHPGDSAYRSLYATTLHKTGRTADAISQFYQASALHDGYGAATRLPEYLLITGDVAAAAKYMMPIVNNHAMRSLSGKRVLFVPHQGAGDGDNILAASQLRCLTKAGASVTAALGEAFSGLSFDGIETIRDTSARQFDVRLSTADLFAATINELAAGLNATRYVTVDAEITRRWGNLLGESKRRRVGICWHGSTTHPDQDRFANSANLVSMLGLDYEFISLHREYSPAYTFPVTDHLYRDFSDRLSTYADTAALIENLDAVVTVDTAVAHLAGALGKRAIVVLPPYENFRWMSGRGHYASITTVRRQHGEDWQAVFDRACHALDALI